MKNRFLIVLLMLTTLLSPAYIQAYTNSQQITASNATFAIPASWTNTNAIKCVGDGVGGSAFNNSSVSGGSSGPAYAEADNVTGLSGNVLVHIGTGGAGETGSANATVGTGSYFCNSTTCASITAAAVVVAAPSGLVGSGTTGASGTTTNGKGATHLIAGCSGGTGSTTGSGPGGGGPAEDPALGTCTAGGNQTSTTGGAGGNSAATGGAAPGVSSAGNPGNNATAFQLGGGSGSGCGRTAASGTSGGAGGIPGGTGGNGSGDTGTGFGGNGARGECDIYWTVASSGKGNFLIFFHAYDTYKWLDNMRTQLYYGMDVEAYTYKGHMIINHFRPLGLSMF